MYVKRLVALDPMYCYKCNKDVYPTLFATPEQKLGIILDERYKYEPRFREPDIMLYMCPICGEIDGHHETPRKGNYRVKTVLVKIDQLNPETPTGRVKEENEQNT